MTEGSEFEALRSGLAAMAPRWGLSESAEAKGDRYVVSVPAGTTARQAIERSHIVTQHPEIDLSTQSIGIFGKIQSLDTTVSPGDRVEIYRPLIVDPKLARQRRVAKTRVGSVEGRRWLAKERR